jgi:hypothetical protein
LHGHAGCAAVPDYCRFVHGGHKLGQASSMADTERSRTEKVRRRLQVPMRELGFERTKPTFFTHSHGVVIHFIHLHKYSFASKFRVHLGIRVSNDAFPAAALVPVEAIYMLAGLGVKIDPAVRNKIARGVRQFITHVPNRVGKRLERKKKAPVKKKVRTAGAPTKAKARPR